MPKDLKPIVRLKPSSYQPELEEDVRPYTLALDPSPPLATKRKPGNPR